MASDGHFYNFIKNETGNVEMVIDAFLKGLTRLGSDFLGVRFMQIHFAPRTMLPAEGPFSPRNNQKWKSRDSSSSVFFQLSLSPLSFAPVIIRLECFQGGLERTWQEITCGAVVFFFFFPATPKLTTPPPTHHVRGGPLLSFLQLKNTKRPPLGCACKSPPTVFFFCLLLRHNFLSWLGKEKQMGQRFDKEPIKPLKDAHSRESTGRREEREKSIRKVASHKRLRH